jgi:hypothetical protein
MVRSPADVPTKRLTASPDLPGTQSVSAARTSIPSPLRIRCISSATSRSFLAPEQTSMLDDRHTAAKAPEGLREFEAQIAAAEHDQMWRRLGGLSYGLKPLLNSDAPAFRGSPPFSWSALTLDLA